MALHVYVKESYSVRKKAVHLVSYLSLVAGSMMLFWSFYPILSFELYSRLFIQRDVISPVPQSQMASTVTAAQSVLGSFDVYSSNLRDFVHANLWFPSKPQVENDKLQVKEYTLTIPKLNLTDVKVTVGGEDLSRSLVHYIPTSLPGEYGNVAIFGHSTLPQLYNNKDYKTIFTYLPSLEKGDTIMVKVAGATYKYQVYDMFVVKPEQVSVLEQKYDDSYLTLVTCVPPGTYWNRLIVKAKIQKI